MSLMEVIAEVRSLRNTCDNQARIMNDFLSSNRSNAELVRSELNGSSRGHDQRMLSSLKEAEDSLKKAMSALTRAKDALDRVQNI